MFRRGVAAPRCGCLSFLSELPPRRSFRKPFTAASSAENPRTPISSQSHSVRVRKEYSMKRLAMLCVTVAFVASTSGCCYWWPWSGWSGYGCGYGCQPSPCGPGGCGVSQPGTTVFPQTGAIYGTYDTMQAAVPTAAPVTVASPPMVSPYPTTALAPLESLPTY